VEAGAASASGAAAVEEEPIVRFDRSKTRFEACGVRGVVGARCEGVGGGMAGGGEGWCSWWGRDVPAAAPVSARLARVRLPGWNDIVASSLCSFYKYEECCAR
jgi:hypothetical protein